MCMYVVHYVCTMYVCTNCKCILCDYCIYIYYMYAYIWMRAYTYVHECMYTQYMYICTLYVTMYI